MVVNDLSYDVLTALQSKLEALQAYETFIDDSKEAADQECRQLFEKIKADDQRHAEQLRDMLEQLVQAGKLR
jgi:bacterioferritin (cytochrome b1)